MLMKKLGSPWSTIGTQVDSLLLPVGPLDNRYTLRQKNSTRPSPFSFQFQPGVSCMFHNDSDLILVPALLFLTTNY